MGNVVVNSIWGKAMKKMIMIIVLLALTTSLLGCIGYGVITRGGYVVYLKDGSEFHNVLWYKSRTEGVALSEHPTGTVMFLTQDYGLVEVPWANVERIQTE
ncbi:MAG: hypothetical protein JW765_12450 [Deltaproteobacteria bacterium]|nr:hypothetical protein [Candidatus Zymogenaceae bacterium]